MTAGDNMTAGDSATAAVTDAEVLGYVGSFVEKRGYDPAIVTMDTPLPELGLDSLTTVELMLAVREELVNAGKIDAAALPADLPHLEKVADLAALVQSLPLQGG